MATIPRVGVICNADDDGDDDDDENDDNNDDEDVDVGEGNNMSQTAWQGRPRCR